MSDAGPAVEFRSVTRTFPGHVQALRGVDLRVARGETVSITGPSGCGKSTLLHLLAAIDTPTSGEVLVNGVDLAHQKDLSRYRRLDVGLVFQFHNLLPQLTVLANVELPMFGTHRSAAVRRARALALLTQVELAGCADRLPTELSGGERQRVAIARALANEPALLLADEPTGSLDSDSTRLVLDLFGSLGQMVRTVIIVTHAAEVAAVADRTVSMRDGLVVEDASVGAPAIAAAWPG